MKFGLPGLLFWHVAFVHVAWAALLLIAGEPLHTTAMRSINTGNVPWMAQIVLFGGVGSLVLVKLWLGQVNRSTKLALCLQQILLYMSAGDVMECVLKGQYADNAVYPWEFIASDQIHNIVMALVHTVAVLYVFGARLPWRA